MPYIRLYSKPLSLREKRKIAHDLIQITLRAFNLPIEQNQNVTIQFLPQQISRPQYSAVVEVSAREAQPASKRRFMDAFSAMFSRSTAARRRGPLSRFFGISDPFLRPVAFEFTPFIPESDRTFANADLRQRPAA